MVCSGARSLLAIQQQLISVFPRLAFWTELFSDEDIATVVLAGGDYKL